MQPLLLLMVSAIKLDVNCWVSDIWRITQGGLRHVDSAGGPEIRRAQPSCCCLRLIPSLLSSASKVQCVLFGMVWDFYIGLKNLNIRPMNTLIKMYIRLNTKSAVRRPSLKFLHTELQLKWFRRHSLFVLRWKLTIGQVDCAASRALLWHF